MRFFILFIFTTPHSHLFYGLLGLLGQSGSLSIYMSTEDTYLFFLHDRRSPPHIPHLRRIKKTMAVFSDIHGVCPFAEIDTAECFSTFFVSAFGTFSFFLFSFFLLFFLSEAFFLSYYLVDK